MLLVTELALLQPIEFCGKSRGNSATETFGTPQCKQAHDAISLVGTVSGWRRSALTLIKGDQSLHRSGPKNLVDG